MGHGTLVPLRCSRRSLSDRRVRRVDGQPLRPEAHRLPEQRHDSCRHEPGRCRGRRIPLAGGNESSAARQCRASRCLTQPPAVPVAPDVGQFGSDVGCRGTAGRHNGRRAHARRLRSADVSRGHADPRARRFGVDRRGDRVVLSPAGPDGGPASGRCGRRRGSLLSSGLGIPRRRRPGRLDTRLQPPRLGFAAVDDGLGSTCHGQARARRCCSFTRWAEPLRGDPPVGHQNRRRRARRTC